MPHWVNFKELRQKLTFEDVFRHYEITLNIRNGTKQHVGPCPLPQHEGEQASASFSANLEKKIFQCFGCKGSGNILDFICLKEGLNPKEGSDLRKAALKAEETFFAEKWAKTSSQRNARKKDEPEPELPLREQPVPRLAGGRSIKMRLLTKEIRRRQAMLELAHSFPSLRDAASSGWDAEALDEKAVEFKGSQRFAAQFLLEVWNEKRDWKVGRFSVVEALKLWDEAHLQAFLGWVSDPW